MPISYKVLIFPKIGIQFNPIETSLRFRAFSYFLTCLTAAFDAFPPFVVALLSAFSLQVLLFTAFLNFLDSFLLDSLFLSFLAFVKTFPLFFLKFFLSFLKRFFNFNLFFAFLIFFLRPFLLLFNIPNSGNTAKEAAYRSKTYTLTFPLLRH